MHMELDPDLGRINFHLGSQNNMPDDSNGVSAVSYHKEAVQFSVSFEMSLFASF